MSDKRLFDYLHEQAKNCPQNHAFGHKIEGKWQFRSSADLVNLANQLSLGLLNLGLKKGDAVATVVAKCSPEWVALDVAMLQIGVLNVPLYPSISPREYAYILNEAECKFCFAGDADLYDKVCAAKSQTPHLQEVLTFCEHPTARRLDSILPPEGTDAASLDALRAAIHPDDLATLVYTSGTTGNPKGVMLSHRNIVFNCESILGLAPLRTGQRVLSFLPVSHIFERAAVYVFTKVGMEVHFTGADNLGGPDGDLATVRPHWFTAVPRLLEKVYDRIYAKGLELTGLKHRLFFWALRLAGGWEFDQKIGTWLALKRWLADRLIFSKWRTALGGSVEGIITGASACPENILRTFNAAGIAVREGYGLSEAAPALSFNGFAPGDAMLGTVGKVLDGVEIRLEPDADFRPGEGEILARSPGNMLGYFKQPEKTAEMLREIDGQIWLVTGDVGRFVAGPSGGQFLKITDRKKELLKTSLGKYVAPAPIESRLKEDPLIEQAMVVGDGLKFVSALLVPAEEPLRTRCLRAGLGWSSLREMVGRAEVLAFFQKILDDVNPEFAHHEQVKKFALLPDAWEASKTDGSDAELTPTLKLKRRVILGKFKGEIEGMYA